MAQMKIEAIDRIRDTDEGREIQMEPGDQLTVSAEFGRYACAHGWAKDVAGEVATGERAKGPATVIPRNVVSPNATR